MAPLPPKARPCGDDLLCHDPLCDSVLCHRDRIGRLTSRAARMLRSVDRRDVYYLVIPGSYSKVADKNPARYQERSYVAEARRLGGRYDREKQTRDLLPPEGLPVVFLCRQCKELSSLTADLLAC